MAEPARHLHLLVNTETGERHEFPDGCPHCSVKDDEIKGLQRDIRGWAARYAELERDKDAEARASKYWPAAVEIFEAWKAATGHKNSEWTSDRFWLIEPFLRRKKYGYEKCLRAVAGIAFDHFSAQRRNGTTVHYDEWSRCFKGADEVERFVNAAPKNWRTDPIFAALLKDRA